MNFTGNIDSKLPKIGTNIFTKMSALANEHCAINLAQGFPEFDSGNELFALVNKYMQAGYNQYAPMAGMIQLREAIAEKVAHTYNNNYHPETEITVTAGATEAIYSAITAVVKEDDEVIMFTPAYDCYEPAIELSKGKSICIPLIDNTYQIDWNAVKKVLNRRTRMIIINTPHNPTGAIITEADIKQLKKLTKNTDIIILSDEVYEHIVFDGAKHWSLAAEPELAERSFIMSSFGKTFHNTGWKIGYCLAPANLMEEFRKVHQFVVFAVNTPIQLALAEYIKDAYRYESLNSFYQQKRDYFQQAISGSNWEILPCKGTYFQLLGYKNIAKTGDVQFAEELTIKHKIASIPVSVFYNKATDNNVLRFCFAKSNETLDMAAAILNQF
jgi:methionine aminotransferase